MPIFLLSMRVIAASYWRGGSGRRIAFRPTGSKDWANMYCFLPGHAASPLAAFLVSVMPPCAIRLYSSDIARRYKSRYSRRWPVGRASACRAAMSVDDGIPFRRIYAANRPCYDMLKLASGARRRLLEFRWRNGRPRRGRIDAIISERHFGLPKQ